MTQLRSIGEDDDWLQDAIWHDPFPHLAPFLVASPRSSESPPPTPPSSWISDIELMHHYDTSTSYTLPGSVEFRHVHQVEYVRLAFNDEALMHQLLAVSSFHLARLDPGRRHASFMRGLQHQTEAAQGIRARLAHLTSETSPACFVSGVLLVIGSFASLTVFHDVEGAHKPALDDLVHLFYVVRGMYAVLKSSEDIIYRGCLASLLRQREYSRQAARLEPLLEDLRDLAQIIRQRYAHAEPNRSRVVEAAISSLVANIRYAVRHAPTPYEWRPVTGWPITLSQDFLLLLAEKDELALAVVARFCVVLHEAHPVAWFTAGWGRSVLKDIVLTSRGLAAEGVPRHSDLLSWPLSRVLGSE